ncbi:MAG TPA: helix-turn-helix domain-containing protein [Solirubrobacteraceae bacterium]
MSRLAVPLQSSVGRVRRAEGWTQQRLAYAAGVSRQTVVELEGGGYNPSTVLALRLALLLGVVVEDLFSLAADDEAAIAMAREGHASMKGVRR